MLAHFDSMEVSDSGRAYRRVSMNDKSSSQKAVIALEIEERLAEEARTRRLAGLKQNESLRNELGNGGNNPSTSYLGNGSPLPFPNSFLRGESVKQAAEAFGINHQYVSDAKKIKRQAPELLEPIRDGLITIPRAKKVAALSIQVLIVSIGAELKLYQVVALRTERTKHMTFTPIPDRFLSFAEVAEMTGLREETVRNGECGTDELLRIKLSTKNTMFSFSAVQTWLLQQARKALVTREWQEDAVREYLTKIGKARRRGGKKIVKDAVQTIVNGGFEYESEIEEAR